MKAFLILFGVLAVVAAVVIFWAERFSADDDTPDPLDDRNDFLP